MSVFSLPTFDDPFYSYAITLEGKPYVLGFKYNQREDVWYMSVFLPDLTPLATGVKLVENVDLVPRSDERSPPGRFIVVSLDASNTTPPGLGELGEDSKRVVLLYATSDEFA
jgi:hypothetical protein